MKLNSSYEVIREETLIELGWKRLEGLRPLPYLVGKICFVCQLEVLAVRTRACAHVIKVAGH
jgi:hypothetical protein